MDAREPPPSSASIGLKLPGTRRTVVPRAIGALATWSTPGWSMGITKPPAIVGRAVRGEHQCTFREADGSGQAQCVSLPSGWVRKRKCVSCWPAGGCRSISYPWDCNYGAGCLCCPLPGQNSKQERTSPPLPLCGQARELPATAAMISPRY